MSNWRFCKSLAIAYIDQSGEVHFADSEQKNYVKELDKLIKEGGRKYLIENSGFSVRLSGVNLYISNPEIGEGEFLLQNSANIEDILKIVSESGVEISEGVFKGNNWCFVIDYNKNFLPVKEGMKIYEDAELEAVKKIVSSTSTKTSKWEPGYRYDSEDSRSVYYLGTATSWKTANKYSTLTPAETEFHMVLESDCFNPRDTTKTLEEIIKENFFNIKFYTKKSSLFKSNVKFISGPDKVNKITTLWDSIIENWIKENETTYSNYSNLITYRKNVGELLSLFLHTANDKDVPVLSEKGENMLTSVIRNYLYYLLVTYYDKCNYFSSKTWIGKGKTIEENCANLKQILFIKIIDSLNYHKEEYFTSLFMELGINLDTLIQDVVSSFNPAKMFDTWQDYLNNISNIAESFGGDFTEVWIDESKIKPKDSFFGYYNSNVQEISALKDPYKTIFSDIFQYCVETSKNPVEYTIKNRGTLSKPAYVEQFRITIDTIMRKYENNVPEKVAKPLIDGRFLRLTYIRDLKK